MNYKHTAVIGLLLGLSAAAGTQAFATETTNNNLFSVKEVPASTRIAMEKTQESKCAAKKCATSKTSEHKCAAKKCAASKASEHKCASQKKADQNCAAHKKAETETIQPKH